MISLITIKVADQTGKPVAREVRAEVYGTWAVHRAPVLGGWAITHVATGLCVPPFYTEDLSKGTAVRVAKALDQAFPNADPADPSTGKQMAELIWKVSLGRPPA